MMMMMMMMIPCIKTQRRRKILLFILTDFGVFFLLLLSFLSVVTIVTLPASITTRRRFSSSTGSTERHTTLQSCAVVVDEELSSSSLSSSVLPVDTDTIITTAIQNSTNTTSSSSSTNIQQHHHTTTGSRTPNNKKQWNWDPKDKHPCNIRRYTAEEWQQTRLVSIPPQQPKQQRYDRTKSEHTYFANVPLSLTGTTVMTKTNYGIVPSLYHEPIIIQQNHTINEVFRYKTQCHRILQQFPNHTTFRVTLSSSNALSEHRQSILFRDYLQRTTRCDDDDDDNKNNNNNNHIDSDDTMSETFPDQWSNESWYLFGETYTEDWYNAIVQYYTLPPCQTCDDHDQVALSFGIGHRGSGVQWHTHGPGFSEAVHGRKHWILHPPTRRPPPRTRSITTTKYPIHPYQHHNNNHTTTATATNVPIDQYHKDQSSRYWMEYVYPFLPKDIREQNYYECTLDPGDVIYFPNHWWHATINLDRYTAFISTFTNEHTTL